MDKKLGENIVLNVSYNVLSIIVPFITAPYLGRVLGASNVGTYTYVYSIACYFAMFGFLGVSNYGTREIAKVRNNRIDRSRMFWEIYGMQFISGTVVILVYIIYCIINNSTIRTYLGIMSLYVFMTITDTAWYCQGTEKFRCVVARNAIIKAINLICIFAFIKTEEDLFAYVLLMAGCYFVSTIALWPTILNDVDFIKPSFTSVRKHFKPNILLFIPAIAASIYQMMDKIMIGAIANTVQLGYYEYADKILNIPNVIFGSISAVMLSRMSHIFHNDSKNFNSLFSYSIDLSIIISCAFAFGVGAISSELVIIYYGTEFAESGRILKILSPIIVLYGWNNVLRMQYIIPNNLNSIYIKSTIAGATVNLLFNWFFIPRYGAMGATVGTIAAQCTISLFYIILLRGKVQFGKFIRNNLFVVLSGFVMFIIITLIENIHRTTLFWLIIDILVGSITYIILILLIGNRRSNHLISKLERIILKRRG